MIGTGERNRLMRDYMQRPGCAWGVVLRCAAGLVILALIALIGFDAKPVREDIAAPSMQIRERAAISHSKELYEQRAAGFQAVAASGAANHDSFRPPAVGTQPIPSAELDEMVLSRASD